MPPSADLDTYFKYENIISLCQETTTWEVMFSSHMPTWVIRVPSVYFSVFTHPVFIIIANASALVILSCGRKVVLVRETSPASAASSTARQIQSFLRVSQKYLLHVYHSGSIVPRSFSAIPATSARVIVSSRR